MKFEGWRPLVDVDLVALFGSGITKGDVLLDCLSLPADSELNLVSRSTTSILISLLRSSRATCLDCMRMMRIRVI